MVLLTTINLLLLTKQTQLEANWMVLITKITLFSADEPNQTRSKLHGSYNKNYIIFCWRSKSKTRSWRRSDLYDLLRQQSENVKLRRPGWPETHFHEEFHENWNSTIFSIFSHIFQYFSIFFVIFQYSNVFFQIIHLICCPGVISDSANMKNIEKSIFHVQWIHLVKNIKFEMRTKAPAEKKVGSTELAETLSKFNYNQYVVAFRVWAKTNL